ncbi:MAG: PIN domain-containing protein [Candidatus Altiarchaeota archaeon]
MTGIRLLIDSSIWLAYFLALEGKVATLIDSEENTLYTSVISLHEVQKKLAKMGHTSHQIAKAIAFMKQNSVLVQIDAKIAEASVAHCREHGLHTVDALIYETAVENKCTLLTGDYDFKNLPNTEIFR